MKKISFFIYFGQKNLSKPLMTKGDNYSYWSHIF